MPSSVFTLTSTAQEWTRDMSLWSLPFLSWSSPSSSNSLRFANASLALVQYFFFRHLQNAVPAVSTYKNNHSITRSTSNSEQGGIKALPCAFASQAMPVNIAVKFPWPKSRLSANTMLHGLKFNNWDFSFTYVLCSILRRQLHLCFSLPWIYINI